MVDVDQKCKEDAATWQKLRWHLAEAEKLFEQLARVAENRREQMREESIKGIIVCTFCLKPAIEGTRPPKCLKCMRDLEQGPMPTRLSWWQWFKNLFSKHGRGENEFSKRLQKRVDALKNGD